MRRNPPVSRVSSGLGRIEGWLQARHASCLIPSATLTFSENGEISYWCKISSSDPVAIAFSSSFARRKTPRD
jgi:hypothetical protein